MTEKEENIKQEGSMSEEIKNLGKRQNDLERDVGQINDKVSTMGEQLATAVTNISHISVAVDNVMKEMKSMSNDNKTPWQTIIMFAGLITATVGGLFMFAIGPMKEDINGLQDADKNTVAELTKRAEFMGYSKALTDLHADQIETINGDLKEVVKSRFSNEDGESMRIELGKRLDLMESLILDHQINHHEKE